MILEPWFVRDPERLDAELEAFRSWGIAAEPDRVEQARGRVVVGVTWSSPNGDIELIVVYPDFFPHQRPEVYAPGLRLDRHQNPYDKNLCLLDRTTRAWDSWLTAAELIEEQLPAVMRTQVAPPAERAALEVAQGEPVTEFLGGVEGAVVFLSEPMLGLPRDCRTGQMLIRLAASRPHPALVRGLLDQARSAGRAIAEAEGLLRDRFMGPKLRGRWVRMPKAPASRNPEEIRAEVASLLRSLREERWVQVGDGWEVEVIGCLFPVEVRLDTIEDGWIFVVRMRRSGEQPKAYLARGERLSQADLAERIPLVAGLNDKTIALAGAGTLGAAIAFELARAQLGHLRVLDRDWVETGTIVRWGLGLPAVGYQKVNALRDALHAFYPFLRVTAIDANLGAAPLEAASRSDREAVAELLDGADLLIDATAEYGLNHLFSDIARGQQIPTVVPWGTEGGWGGGVLRTLPEKKGCWYCLMHLFTDRPDLLPPLDERTGTTQPRGCATRTFTGTSFDALPIVAQATRVGVQTLLRGMGRAYPSNDHDIFILRLRDESGPLPAPEWLSLQLDVHPRCPYCSES